MKVWRYNLDYKLFFWGKGWKSEMMDIVEWSAISDEFRAMIEKKYEVIQKR
jgi:hypothetical protein